MVVGVLGSISFPFLRKKLGLTRTGLVGMCLLVIMTSMCLVSIWVEGSPFQPDYFTSVANKTSNSDQGNLLRGIVIYVLNFYPPKSCFRILISYLEF